MARYPCQMVLPQSNLIQFDKQAPRHCLHPSGEEKAVLYQVLAPPIDGPQYQRFTVPHNVEEYHSVSRHSAGMMHLTSCNSSICGRKCSQRPVFFLQPLFQNKLRTRQHKEGSTSMEVMTPPSHSPTNRPLFTPALPPGSQRRHAGIPPAGRWHWCPGSWPAVQRVPRAGMGLKPPPLPIHSPHQEHCRLPGTESLAAGMTM